MLTRSKSRSTGGLTAEPKMKTTTDTDRGTQNKVKATKAKANKHKMELSPVAPKKHRIPARTKETDGKKSSVSPVKSPPNGENLNSIDTANDAALHSCYGAIKEVLTMKYTNAVERLQLSFPAKCTRALEECSQKHARNGVSVICIFPHN